MEQWRGKVAIVTGASAGIGAAIVVKLVESGVHVVALARRENVLKELAESLTGKDNGTIYTKVCDVTNEQAVKDVFSWVDSTLGGPSILINNAGIARVASLLNGKLEDWQETLNLNVLALSVCSREAYKSMTKNKIDGHIIQINSVTGHSIIPYIGLKMYNASKTAVTVLCDGLRHELQLVGSKIKVSIADPVRSALNYDCFMNTLSMMCILSNMSVPGTAVEKLAMGIPFLLSISPGPVATDMVVDVRKIFTDRPPAGYKILHVEDIVNAVITSLATPPNVLIAEMTIIPTGSSIQTHLQPSAQVVENVLNS